MTGGQRAAVLVAAVACLAALIAARIGSHRSFPHDDSLAARVAAINPARSADEVPCPAAGGRAPLVLLVLGQSNAASHGEVPARAADGVVWVGGRCYPIADPLPATTGRGGSIWTRLATRIAAEQPTRPLMLVVLAVDATTISDWTVPGALTDRLGALLDALRASRLPVSAVLWQQGEADAEAGTTKSDYQLGLAALVARLRAAGIAAPILLAQSTRCRNSGSSAIREAQWAVASGGANVFRGPVTDALGDAWRFDGCHFSTAGLDRAADAWLDALRLHGIVGADVRPSARVAGAR